MKKKSQKKFPYNFQAKSAFQKKDFLEAIRLYSHVLVVSPKDAQVLCNIAACYLATDKNEAALKAAILFVY